MNRKRIPTNSCFAFWTIFQSLLVVVVALLFFTPSSLNAWQDVSLAPQAQELSITEIGAWKTKQFQRLKAKIAEATNATDRKELTAQKDWLSNWQPGRMSPTPLTPKKEDTREKRSEPILKTPHVEKLHAIIDQSEKSDRAKFLELDKLASRFPKDIGLKLAFLHWMDDDSTRRKQFLDEIEQLIARLEAHFRLSVADRKSQPVYTDKPPANRERQIYEFILYRRVRALAYRELPDVVAKEPIVDQAALNEKLEAAFESLIEIAGSGRPEFILIEVRMHRRAKRFGMALSLLEKYGHSISPKWYLKKRRDLLKELHWIPPWREAAEIYESRYPELEPLIVN